MAKICERNLGQTGEGSHIKKTKGFEENVYSRVSNRRGGRNKRESWQISAKIINLKSAINGEVGKNLQFNKRGGCQKQSNFHSQYGKIYATQKNP